MTKVKNSLVEANEKHGFDLKTLISISNYSYYIYGDIEGITYFPSGHDRSISMVEALPISPLTMTQAPLYRLNLTSFNRGNVHLLRNVFRREKKSFGTVLL